MLLGIPVHWSTIPDDMQAALRLSGFTQGAPTYSGSIQVECSQCERLVWLGPRQQAQRSQMPVVCLVCAARFLNSETKIEHLGNEEETENN